MKIKFEIKKQLILSWSTFWLTCLITPICIAQNHTKSNKNIPQVHLINDAPNLPPIIIEGLKTIIYKVYPKLVKDFNKQALMDLTVKIDTTYEGVAYAHNGRVTVSSQYLTKHPKDLDLMTHEIMHIIQSYPNGAGPSWLTEGIADYVRHKYALNNDAAGWTLPNFSTRHHYKNSYRITARFLLWITQNHDKHIVTKLDKQLRANNYSSKLWKDYTKLDIDQLWSEYSKNPKVK